VNAIESLHHFIPQIILIATGFLILVADVFGAPKRALGWTALAAIALALFSLRFPVSPLPLFFGFFRVDGFSVFFSYAALIITGLTLLLALAFKGISERQEGELYAIMIFLSLGLILMASSTNLLMIFLAIEFVSISSYILVGYQKDVKASNEASLKYLLFGSVASAVMLYGMSLVFGLTGSIDLVGIREALTMATAHSPLFMIAFCFLLVGLAFKISAAPFHMWAPDVYTGAPTPVTAFLTVGPKALGFAVLLRVLYTAFPIFEGHWSVLIAIISALTMTVGNVIAVSQTNIKRLLAYSSIAQAGYILMGVAAANHLGFGGILYYLAAYALTNLGAFAIVIIASNNFKNDEIESYAGLSKKSPFLAIALTLFFISLAGLPPLAGYIGKFLVFASVIQDGLIPLAVIAALNSAIAVYYYFKVVKQMYFTEPANDKALVIATPAMATVLIAFVAIILLGIFPAPLIQLVTDTMSF